MPSVPETPSRPSRVSGGPSPFALIVVLLVLVTAGVLAFRNMLSSPGAQTQNAPAPGSKDDVKSLVARVARHIVVNEGEDPTIATIEDADLLRAQSPTFYKDAQNGDRLLVWSDKAVLYSTSRDLLLAVMPVSLPPPADASSTSMAQTTTSTTEVVEQATIEVRNGTRTSGLGRKMVDTLKAAGLTVLPATDARLKTYEKTVIIVKDATASFPKTLQTIKEITNAEVVPASLEEGQLKGDIVVIVGADAIQ
jgi:hypothetical protein